MTKARTCFTHQGTRVHFNILLRLMPEDFTQQRDKPSASLICLISVKTKIPPSYPGKEMINLKKFY